MRRCLKRAEQMWCPSRPAFQRTQQYVPLNLGAALLDNILESYLAVPNMETYVLGLHSELFLDGLANVRLAIKFAGDYVNLRTHLFRSPLVVRQQLHLLRRTGRIQACPEHSGLCLRTEVLRSGRFSLQWLNSTSHIRLRPVTYLFYR